jgi:hypothetical protein
VTKVYGDYLEHGDVVQPSVREGRTGVREDREEPPPRTPRPSGRPAEALVLLAVLAVGWLAGSSTRHREGR